MTPIRSGLKHSPTPWFFNSYSRVSSRPLSDAWEDDKHIWTCEKATKDCHECYDKDPTVADVPPITGDTSVGRHRADGEFIVLAVNAYDRDQETISLLTDVLERVRLTLIPTQQHTNRIIDEVLVRVKEAQP